MKALIKLFFLFLSFILMNCQNKNDVFNTNKKIGRRIILNNCVLLPIDENFSFDSLMAINSIKLIHFFNGDCPICIAELGVLDEALNRESHHRIFPHLYIFSSSFMDQSIFNIAKFKYKGYVFYDSNGSLLKNNIFLGMRESNTCILNAENEIVFIGNPILNKQSQSAFFHHLKSIIPISN